MSEEKRSISERYNAEGCIVIPKFCTPDECQKMKDRMTELVDAWDGSTTCAFSTQNDTQSKSSYFFSSADQIHFFVEKSFDKEHTSKLHSLNKVGHGLHLRDDVFKEYAFSDKVKSLIKQLGYRDPVLPQSMYIMKNPVVGGEVTSHQDSTFLYTTPRLTCLGMWLALDEATTENGCLWARLGSHKEKLRKRWARKEPEKEEMEFIELDQTKVPLDGDDLKEATIESVKAAGFSCLPCNVGDLVLIHGEVDHLSLANRSDKQRHTFQLHLVEGEGAGVTWEKGNWLQYPHKTKFPSLRLA